MTAVTSTEILIVGAGVIGLTTAVHLADRGRKVLVIDQGAPARQASWAGAGMLPPGYVTQAFSPEARLRSLSCQLWPQLNQRLRDLGCDDNEYHQCGSVLLFEDTAAAVESVRQWTADGAEAELLDERDLRQSLPQINDCWSVAVRLPQQAQVRNPRHLKALLQACSKLGVTVRQDLCCPALPCSENLHAIAVNGQRIEFSRMLISSGAWSGDLLAGLDCSLPVHPVRGQIAQLQGPPGLLSTIIECERRYLVPRRDGRILIGSTEEHAGFSVATTDAGIAGLRQFAADLVPGLADLPLVNQWAGLRPGSPDELPAIGLLPGSRNIFVAVGHFRSGLQMSPGTGAVAAALLCDEAPAIDLGGLEPERFLQLQTDVSEL